MEFNKLIKKEKQLWHEHFVPSLIAGLAVALISYGFQKTLSDIVLFASVGASAVILTHSRSHHLTRLRTTIEAYIIAIIVSSLIFFISLFLNLNISVSIFIVIFLVSILMYSINAFHPPAITASLSFILLERPIIDLFYLFVAILILFILIRLLTYTLSQHLPVKEFLNEFKRSA